MRGALAAIAGGRRPLEREDLDRLLRARAVSRGAPSSNAPPPRLAVHSSPAPKSCTNPNVTSSIVGPSATASESEKYGIPRLALTEPSTGSTTTRTGPPSPKPRSPSSSETSVKSQLERLEPTDDRVLAGGVDRRRVVAALARRGGPARARDGSAARRGSPRRRRRTRGRARASRVTARAGGRGVRRAASGRSTSSSAASPRRAAHARTRPRCASRAAGTRSRPAPRSTRATASARSGVYAIPSWPKRSTSSTSSSPTVAVDEARTTGRGARATAAAVVGLAPRGASIASSTVASSSPATARRPAVR